MLALSKGISMYIKKRDKIRHEQARCVTGHCEYEKVCKKNYDFCHEHTGFTLPCFTCSKKGYCRIYAVSVKVKKPIMNCIYWERDGNDE